MEFAKKGLAYELRVKTLETQKRFIRRKLEECANSRDGNVTYVYYGKVHEEVKEYFEQEGFFVEEKKDFNKEPYACVFTVGNVWALGPTHDEDWIKSIEYADELEAKNKEKFFEEDDLFEDDLFT